MKIKLRLRKIYNLIFGMPMNYEEMEPVIVLDSSTAFDAEIDDFEFVQQMMSANPNPKMFLRGSH